MAEKNKDFVEKTSKRALKAIVKEEKERLTELVDAAYYPNEKDGKQPDNLTLVKVHLNLIQ
jgi:hypothetical protein